MKTLLDSPLFSLKPDASARQYANCSNTLEVVRGAKVSYAYVQVSASLFHLMRFLGVPVGAEVTLYLDIEGAAAIFGISINGTEIVDLWTYNARALPPFLAGERPQRRG